MVEDNTEALSRMSTLGLSNDYIPYAINLLSAVSSQVNSTGYVNQVTDPYSFDKQGDMSPEAQSFVVLSYKAYQDWDGLGRAGAGNADLGKDSGAGRGVGDISWRGAVGVGLAVLGGMLLL